MPYGSEAVRCSWSYPVEPAVIQARFHNPIPFPLERVDYALDHPLSHQHPFRLLTNDSKVAITINDKTRPVPNQLMLPPLIKRLSEFGIADSNINIFIASGTHKPMEPDELEEILPMEVINRFQVISHDCDDHSSLDYVCSTTSGTPVWVNSKFFNADLRIVIGDIEPHHFAGYSGGVKSAAIGLCGRETITANHSLLLDERSTIGEYDQNPLRKDIEEIGRIIKVDLALNSVLDDQKQLIEVFFGDPVSVMRAGITLIDEMCRIPIASQFDVVVASAGGYPRDINLYQAQKAMTTAAQFCKPGGKLILIAECREGIGSPGYERFMHGVSSVKDVLSKFSDQEFSLGAHKAFLTARIQEKVETYLVSSLSGKLASSLFFTPIDPASHDICLNHYLSTDSKLAFLPYAPVCMPGEVKEVK